MLGFDATDATAAAHSLIEELQSGWDAHDADITDRSLAMDVVWGSPYGQSVQGFDELHGIHERLKQRRAGGDRAQFELVRVLAPGQDSVIVQLRRNTEADGFSELAMYVLIRRGARWWIAAAQNTRIEEPPANR
jgi:hypothetical protein